MIAQGDFQKLLVCGDKRAAYHFQENLQNGVLSGTGITPAGGVGCLGKQYDAAKTAKTSMSAESAAEKTARRFRRLKMESPAVCLSEKRWK